MTAWLLVFHLLAMVLWVGGLLAATLILTTHSRPKGAEAHRALSESEAKILKGMAHPGAALAVITGVLLILQNPGYYLSAGWLHTKLLAVLLLIALDLRIHFRAKAFRAGKIQMRTGECIALHSGSALLFLAILILVLVKPF
ncbi:MAG: CopD family protein [Acidobacteria bacterium]|nr:CopD family protein [Acidobacteriota bacterium]